MQPRIKQQQQKSVPTKRKCNNNNNEKRKINKLTKTINMFLQIMNYSF